MQIKTNKDDIDDIKSHGGAVPPDITNKLNQLDTKVGQRQFLVVNKIIFNIAINLFTTGRVTYAHFIPFILP